MVGDESFSRQVIGASDALLRVLPLRFAFMAALPLLEGSCLSRHRGQCAGAESELYLGTVSAHFDLIS